MQCVFLCSVSTGVLLPNSAFGVEMFCSSVTGISHYWSFLNHLWFSGGWPVVSSHHLLYWASLYCTIDLWDLTTFGVGTWVVCCVLFGDISCFPLLHDLICGNQKCLQTLSYPPWGCITSSTLNWESLFYTLSLSNASLKNPSVT